MKKNGFTLIELMVTIAIIGLLAAIALPRFAGVTEDAKVANVQGNLANLRTASEMFMAKNDTRKFEDIFNMESDILKEEFQEFYSKGKIPPVKPGKNLEHEKIGITRGRKPYFMGANTDSYWGKYAFYVHADPIGENPDKPNYYNYVQMYALLEKGTYGADIDWEKY